MLAAGTCCREIERALGWISAKTEKWKERFLERRTAGLWGRHQGSTPRVRTPALELRILSRTRRPPTHETTHWSTRRLARAMKLWHSVVAQAWQQAGIQPHRLERYTRSTVPDFRAEVGDVIGLHLHPPHHAAVFCLDEKTAIQALDRLDPLPPVSPGRAERHGFKYYRHGTLSLYAALNTGTGELLGDTTPRHASAEFVRFLTTMVASQPPGRTCASFSITCPPTRRSRARRFSRFIPR